MYFAKDRILVLDGGRVVAMGRHEELLASCEVYRGLVGDEVDAGAASARLQTGGGA